MFEYNILKKSKTSKARIGIFKTPHGDIETPVFMPVGTVGAVKTMRPDQLRDLGAQIILGNTYHLHLRPGEKLIKKLGGLHGFSKWTGPILTDSGGFQVFSLGSKKISDRNYNKTVKPAKISDKGVEFFSHIDGSRHFISPEKSIKIQEDLGADIIMAFDHCPPAGITRDEVERAVLRTHTWLKRCIEAKKDRSQALFPICQGGVYKDIRENSANFINSLNMPGNAIGGVSVGEQKKDIYEVTDWCTDILDEKKPRYLMGIGYPEDIVEVVKGGVDMFDCVLPTRLARHGVVWHREGIRGTTQKKSIYLDGLGYNYCQTDLSKSVHKNDVSKISNNCRCYTCENNFSKAYIRHLILENEPLGIHLTTVHNLQFIFDLVEDIKSQIRINRL